MGDRDRSETAAIVAAGYDAVYAAVPHAPTLWRLWQEHAAGPEFPSEFSHISFVTRPDLLRLGEELQLRAGGTLVDLACGMGGPSMLLAANFPIAVAGVDVSPVAVELASARASQLGLGKRAGFRLGTFARTGLDPGSARALVSFDALQYAPGKAEACAEMARVVTPGGRVAVTAFEVIADRASDLPVLGDDPVDDYRPQLERAGFAVDTYEATPAWETRLTAAYRAILDHAELLESEMGVDAYGALALEVAVTLERRPYRRRVLILATRR